MKLYNLLTVIFVASLTLSGCASNSLCHAAFDVAEGTLDNYADRQERESRDLYRLNDDKFKDEDLAFGALTAGIRGIARLFTSDSKSDSGSKCP